MNQNQTHLTFMKLSRLSLIFLFVALNSYRVDAQIIYDCIDTNRINPYYNCGDPNYTPVCGCNGVTYRNPCSAFYVGGVNYTSNGSCGNFDIDILQNPVAYDLTLSVYTRNTERVLIQIWNLFGKIVYEYSFNGIELSVQQFFIETSSWDRGMYLIVVVVNGEPQIKKLVKASAL